MADNASNILASILGTVSSISDSGMKWYGLTSENAYKNKDLAFRQEDAEALRGIQTEQNKLARDAFDVERDKRAQDISNNNRTWRATQSLYSEALMNKSIDKNKYPRLYEHISNGRQLSDLMIQDQWGGLNYKDQADADELARYEMDMKKTKELAEVNAKHARDIAYQQSGINAMNAVANKFSNILNPNGTGKDQPKTDITVKKDVFPAWTFDMYGSGIKTQPWYGAGNGRSIPSIFANGVSDKDKYQYNNPVNIFANWAIDKADESSDYYANRVANADSRIAYALWNIPRAASWLGEGVGYTLGGFGMGAERVGRNTFSWLMEKPNQ